MLLQLTKQKIEEAFEFIGQRAAEKGLVIEIAVYGGSCLILATDIRTASGDVDAVFLTERSIVREIADATARQFHMPTNWLNEAVKRYAPPVGNPRPRILPFGEYPKKVSTGIGLRVHLPTPEYMLAMKILSFRFDEEDEKVQTDLTDAVGLMKITKLTTKDHLIALMKNCYPNLLGVNVDNKMNSRITLKIETLLDAYAANKDTHIPTWNAGRGAPTRDSRER